MDRSFTRYHGSDIIEQGMKDVTWTQVRSERDQALKDSDWRALKDVVLSNAWKEYRQALRDLGGFASSNEACDNWPEAPEDA